MPLLIIHPPLTLLLCGVMKVRKGIHFDSKTLEITGFEEFDMADATAFCQEMEEEAEEKPLANHVTLIYAQSLGRGDFR